MSSVSRWLTALVVPAAIAGLPLTAQAKSNKMAVETVAPAPAMTPVSASGAGVISLTARMPAQVKANKPFTYDIVVTNTTDAAMKNVTLRDKPEGMSIQRVREGNGAFRAVATQPAEAMTATRPAEATSTTRPAAEAMTAEPEEPEATAEASPRVSRGGEMILRIGTLQAHESRVITIEAVAQKEGKVRSSAACTFEVMTSAQACVVRPALKCALNPVSDMLICESRDANITATVSNPGSGEATNVRVRFTMPEGLTAANAEPSVFIGTLAPGESRPVSISARVKGPGRYNVPAVATADDDLRVDVQPVAFVAREPKLTLDVAGPSDEYITKPLVYTATVANTGDGQAPALTVTFALPAGVRFVKASEGGAAADGAVTWNVGRLDADTSRDFRVQLCGDEPASFKVTWTATDACAGRLTRDIPTNVKGLAAMLVECVDQRDPIRVGSNEIYEITVLNQGSAPETNLRVTAEMPEGLEFVSLAGPTKVGLRGEPVSEKEKNLVRFETMPSLAPKEKAVWRLTAKAAKPGDVRFYIRIESDQHNSPVEETEATRIYE